jgi:hypothetical protein
VLGATWKILLPLARLLQNDAGGTKNSALGPQLSAAGAV